jgi:catechol 2,3-dioxygenase-like lactoylglutathione lyase family enzyme
MFKEIHPILGTREIQRAIEFYTEQLGFKLAFTDKVDSPNYVGFRRDAVVLHMQFQFEHEMGTIRLRFLVEDRTYSSMNTTDVASSALPTALAIRPGGPGNSHSTIWIAMHSPFTGSLRVRRWSEAFASQALKPSR